MEIYNREKFKSLRSKLRKSMPASEQKLWRRIRNKQLGVKFRRQQGIGNYIVDFYCSEIKLVVEIDGDSHYSDDAIEADQKRDRYLASLGLKVVRYTNRDILSNLNGVLEDLVNIIVNLKLSAHS